MPKSKKAKSKKQKPVKKSTARKLTPKNSSQKENFKQSIPERLKLDESYRSLVLGALVVLFLIIFLIAALGSKKAVSEIQTKQSPTPASSATPSKPEVYILKEGEGIWDVAVKFYGDGYRWIEIANANNLDEYSASFLIPGTKLIIPQK